MAYDMSQITERLYVGANIGGPEDVAEVVAAGITHVIDANTDDESPLFPAGRGPSLLPLPTPDDGNHKDAGWFGPAIGFAISALFSPGNIVLCHCAAGVNRGPSLAYAILRALGLKRSLALGELWLCRPVCRNGVAYRDDAEQALLMLRWIKQVES
jgi:protein-tyrosine phosphatase